MKQRTNDIMGTRLRSRLQLPMDGVLKNSMLKHCNNAGKRFARHETKTLRANSNTI